MWPMKCAATVLVSPGLAGTRSQRESPAGENLAHGEWTGKRETKGEEDAELSISRFEGMARKI